MALAPALGAIGRVRTSLVTAVHCADGTTVHHRSRPLDLIVSSEPIQQREVNKIPHTRSLPIAQAAPTRHSPTGNAAAEDKQNARETRADRRRAAIRLPAEGWSWQERINNVPQRIGKQ